METHNLHHKIMTKQKIPTLQECLDAPAYSAVTCSPCSIDSSNTEKLYITPIVEGRKKPKDIRFACLGYIQELKAISNGSRNLLTWLVMKRQWRTDGLIIVSFQLCADELGISRRSVIRYFKELVESGCLRLFKKGGSTRGSKREANTYALGSLFDNLPPEKPKRRLVTRVSPVPLFPLVPKVSDDQCQECHPLPIVSPYKNTHTDIQSISKREASLPDTRSFLSLENWLYRGKEMFPDWDERDLFGSYESAVRNGVNGTWELYQIKCYARRFNASPDSPRRSSPAPRPAVLSSCESPQQDEVDYSDLSALIAEIVYAKQCNETLEVIKSCNPLAFEEAERMAGAQLLNEGWFFCKASKRWEKI